MSKNAAPPALQAATERRHPKCPWALVGPCRGRYADNIYYASDTAEANVYLLGGATPSTSQTTQYHAQWLIYSIHSAQQPNVRIPPLH